jgi:hypothetical protein
MVQHLKSTGNMAINKVDLTVSQIINDLNEGLTWFKKDGIGYGSIEAKYNATPNQIAAIKKHPALKDADTNITIFNIIDDTKDENTTNTRTTTDDRSINSVEREVVSVDSKHTTVAVDNAADIFANF